ncbi:TraR/DksA C4-type zinc finger protein [Alkalicoccus saliphilus]|jgi:DnaK suppressor protein|uniref:Molecular chaperone DnaK n=1 Tax=Alkalicoccus saliphilus TaxID=200989 RepID=A0A2T4UA99_9BACI|nr:TraR/DksA C4-type zinc finger protein [Alkalicoccus saliphilus]PTL40311.1 molecular chaperone DnaK [Alkalicoccus saliphilus]
MDNKNLDYLKQMLLERRSELISRKDNTQAEDTELSNYSNHPGDQGTELTEQHTDLALSKKDEDELYDVEEALAKIEEGTYGICEVSGEEIPFERLEAVPTARTTVDNSSGRTDVGRPVEEDVSEPISEKPEGHRDSLRGEFLEEVENESSKDIQERQTKRNSRNK